jgi:hypothetical protein
MNDLYKNYEIPLLLHLIFIFKYLFRSTPAVFRHLSLEVEIVCIGVYKYLFFAGIAMMC